VSGQVLDASGQSQDISGQNVVLRKKLSRPRHKKHLKTPGGFLYLYTLENSKDWIVNGKLIAKHGMTEDKSLDDYLKNHQRKHPTKKLKLIKAYHAPSISTTEKDILAEIEEKEYRFFTEATISSEYVTDIPAVLKIWNDNKSNKWKEVTDSRWF